MNKKPSWAILFTQQLERTHTPLNRGSKSRSWKTCSTEITNIAQCR